MTRIEFDSEDFNTFLRCLTNLKEICNDVDVRNGMIRQRTNDLTSVFEMDLTSLITNAAIPITNLKKKLDLLKTFAGNDVALEIHDGETESDSFFIISDEVSSIKFLFPALEFMDNKYMTEEERDNIFLLDENELVLHNELSTVVSERIKVITDNFNTQSLQVKFSGDKAMIAASTQSKDQTARFKSDIPTNIEFDGSYTSNLSAVPFCIEHDSDLDFKMHKDPNQNLSYNQIKTDLGSVVINVYSRSAIVKDVE
ncbi:MAG TPA: hypothetical protein VMX17_08490 [Candidatus Glassbacteria bacterium]|nr:hypothetical protein [Candidatus Glassbacteria bacterium]